LNGKTLLWSLAAAAVAGAAARGDAVTARIGPATTRPGKLIVTGSGDTQTWRIELDLSGLPAGAKVHRAHLHARRAEPLTGQADWAMTNVVVRPYVARAAGAAAPLKLLGPWYDRFDVTDVVRAHLKSPGVAKGFTIESFPKFDAKTVALHLEYDGALKDPPAQPKGLRVLHRAGQTFITWREIDRRLPDGPVTWGPLRKAMASRDAKRRVRYRVYRHTAAITVKTLAAAECLAEVRPLSCYNVEGRSVERLIYMHRRRSAADIAFARQLAAKWYFGNYRLGMPEMAEVVVDRFVIDAGAKAQPLPAGSGLYVHHPAKAGKAYYAVATSVNGATNTAEFTAANATAAPVAETVGVGEPVFQAEGSLKVYWDYPGTRRYYVQWTAPPLGNLPNRYYNWSVYVPPNPPRPTPVRVFLTTDAFMRPATRHRADTILISGRDGPVRSFWYGHHEALGTLKSFRQGIVRPYAQRRLFAFVDWAMKRFGGDPKRLSAVGGTEALYYGVRHGDRFAYVLTHQPDPNPKVTPGFVKIDTYRRHPPRPQRESVWGKVEWKVPDESGKCVWDRFDLIGHVRDNPKAELAFVSMGPASLSAPWANQVKFMKAMWSSRQGFCARFYWGGGDPLPIPAGTAGAKDAFDFALDLPFLALRNNSNDRGLNEEPFAKEAPRYWSGGRIADGRRWLPDVVDAPGRFEITIHGGGRVTHAGGGTSDVTPRRCRRFKPRPGEALAWENVDLAGGKVLQKGRAVADASGLVTIPKVKFASRPSRLKIYRVLRTRTEK